MESNFRSKIKPIASLRKKFNSDCAFLGVLQHNPFIKPRKYRDRFMARINNLKKRLKLKN